MRDRSGSSCGLYVATLNRRFSRTPLGRLSPHYDLLEARALAAEGKTEQARNAAAQALTQLQGSLGPDHPDTQSARHLAE
jgi:hypothetical protein